MQSLKPILKNVFLPKGFLKAILSYLIYKLNKIYLPVNIQMASERKKWPVITGHCPLRLIFK